MLAGIGIFLLGMTFLEEALRVLAGRPFKLYLRKQAANKVRGVLGGMVVTAVLQSSSIVNLMVLAMVGSNVMRLENALAVILGSNVGTTLDSWIVALIGFRFSIESFVLPILGIAGIFRIALPKTSRGYNWSVFFFGLGAVFLGLEFMKTGFIGLAAEMDFASIKNYPLLFFLFVGFIITTIIQSSYATMAMALSAVYAQAIDILPATAIILGAEIGTTIKLLVAAAGGSSVKRQVAFGNFFYNVLVIAVAFLCIHPITNLILKMGLTNPMIRLVSFQTFINLTGAVLFLPFLKVAGQWLEKRFKDTKTLTAFIHQVPAETEELGLEALKKETKRFFQLTLDFVRHSFQCRRISNDEIPAAYFKLPVADQYDYLKSLHGEIHSWFIEQRKVLQDQAIADQADQLISSVRNTMFAAKSIHDSASDIQQLRNSSKDEKYSLYDAARKEVTAFCKQADVLLHGKEINAFENLVSFYEQVRKDYGSQVSRLYVDGVQLQLNETEISTLINFSRERYSGYKSLMWALKDLILDKKQAAYFSDLPGFIR